MDYIRINCQQCATNLHFHLDEGYVQVRFEHSRSDFHLDHDGYAVWNCPECGEQNELVF